MALLNTKAASMVAEAMLRATGGDAVTVTGAMLAADDGTAGLGLTAAVQQLWELKPVMVRWLTPHDPKQREIVTSATTVKRVFGAEDLETLRALLMKAEVKVHDEALRVVSVTPEIYAGEEYLYRIVVEE